MGSGVAGMWLRNTYYIKYMRVRPSQAVQRVLGCSNIVCWSTDWFAKAPGGFVSWHQDATYAALHPAGDVVTAWLALTPSSAANGCVEFAPGSHMGGQVAHTQQPEPDNMLLYGQTVHTLQGRVVAMELQPGQMSLHHAHTVHRSGALPPGAPRRVGLALRCNGFAWKWCE